MNANTLNYFEENDVAFLRVPKFLRKLVTPKGAELYAVLRERRRWLVEYKKIKNHKSWFYYPTKELQEDLMEPNSVNYLKSLLDLLVERGLIETTVVKRPTAVKYYRIIDDAYLQLAATEANNWVRIREEKYKIERANNSEDDFEPLGIEID